MLMTLQVCANFRKLLQVFAIFFLNLLQLFKIHFLPRDALLSAVYAVVVCLCVCVSVCHTPVLYQNG